ncbi:dienelactone hydrolase family protein [Pelagibius litoralis]|uniref:Dienelactone hydrolase family protein n=1 Tax=Pelagibius litoralis TaxID=374515 RepID=A0A967KE11_9PROT|nr:dienelactone hydrolase family protein [Pelagibius litoralis]NIA71699.1 dienelactone hydrolase family protein [Pelagibius litoralis]
MSEVTIEGKDGSFAVYTAVPDVTPAPGIVVAQEIFGVNQVMRDTCDWLATQGFVAVCPDLFWRIEPGIQLTDQSKPEWDRAFELFGLFDVDKGIEDMNTTLATLRAHEVCNGKAGTLGYCLGGKLAYLMATRSDADCNVGYYGVGLGDLLGEADRITKPLMLHIAEKDAFSSAEEIEKVRQGLGGNDNVTIHVYDGNDHAFAREGGEHYDEAAAKLANDRSVKFFRENLG